jgi:hypothetical protein
MPVHATASSKAGNPKAPAKWRELFELITDPAMIVRIHAIAGTWCVQAECKQITIVQFEKSSV